MTEVVQDTTHVARIITPAGLIITVQQSDFPHSIQQAIESQDLTLAAEKYAEKSGLRVTIEVLTKITANP